MLDTFISFFIGNTRDAPRSEGCVLWGTVLERGDVDWSELYKRANCPFIYWIWFIAWRSLWFEYLVECNLQWWSRLLIWRSLTHRTSQGSCIVCNVLAFAFARGSIPARILRGRRNESSANSSSQLHVSAAMAEYSGCHNILLQAKKGRTQKIRWLNLDHGFCADEIKTILWG